MKKIIALCVVAMTLAGCSSSNEYGSCVGLNGDENPKLKYQYSARNIAVGIVFFELILPPVFVALDELKCPVGQK